jgi:hypothetical protein
VVGPHLEVTGGDLAQAGQLTRLDAEERGEGSVGT